VSIACEIADYVESMAGSGRTVSLRIDGCDAEQRVWVLDAHAEALIELRRRGHEVHSSVVRIGEDETDPDGMPVVPGEYMAIAIGPAPGYINEPHDR